MPGENDAIPKYYHMLDDMHEEYRRIAGVPIVADLRSAGNIGVAGGGEARSEEHTSELQSRGQLVCRLLLEKKTSHRVDCSERLHEHHPGSQGARAAAFELGGAA